MEHRLRSFDKQVAYYIDPSSGVAVFPPEEEGGGVYEGSGNGVPFPLHYVDGDGSVLWDVNDILGVTGGLFGFVTHRAAGA